MTPIVSEAPQTRKGKTVHRRDWFLMPALSLMTVCILVLGIEAYARVAFGSETGSLASCLDSPDPHQAVKAIPNSVCYEKAFESKLVKYAFDQCGYRNEIPCAPRAPDAFRIVMLGSSIALGDRVAIDKSFASLLPKELSQESGRTVQLYNEAMRTGTPHSVSLRFADALRQKPDLILWVVVPYDIEHVSLLDPAEENQNSPAAESGFSYRLQSILKAGLYRCARALRLDPRFHFESVHVVRHFLYESQTLYIRSDLMQGDSAAFLRDSWTPDWIKRIAEFRGYAGEIASRARAAGVPVVVVLIPDRAQAAMISRGEWPSGYNPYVLGEKLRSVITSQGEIYIDILTGFRNIPNPERGYFPVDGHLTSEGNRMICKLLARGLKQYGVIRPDASVN